MRPFSRIVCIVLDGVGVGAAPDASEYHDEGSSSIANTARHVGSLRLPVLGALGLGHISDIDGVPPEAHPRGCFGRLTPTSPGKDSTTGHWELMGCPLERPFPTYPDGFPPHIIDAFEQRIGRGILGNTAASGTAIIQELGDLHVKTGKPIIYTSQDSVFQIAAHKSVIELSHLYEICQAARELLRPPDGVARVIARPFEGRPGGFYRTPERRDFSLEPPSRTVLDALSAVGFGVVSIGKIADLFAGRGVGRTVKTADNLEGMRETLAAVRDSRAEFVFTNLVDFDTMWGHRNDARAYALGLEEFDSYLTELLESLGGDTLLIITSDHGNDPTTPSTDHSREYVPLLVTHRELVVGRSLGTRAMLADVGKTIADNFGVATGFPGESFLDPVRERA